MLSVAVPMTEAEARREPYTDRFDPDNPPCAVWTMRLVISPSDGAWIVDSADEFRTLEEVIETLEQDHGMLTKALARIGGWDETDVPIGKVLLLPHSELADTSLIDGVEDVLVVGRSGLPRLAELLCENPPSAVFEGNVPAARHLAADILAVGAVCDLNDDFLPPCLPKWMIEASAAPLTPKSFAVRASLGQHDRPKPAPSSARKQGRNEPCACGSGRKFKKCCLSSGLVEAPAPSRAFVGV
jgi:hypothetical protein